MNHTQRFVAGHGGVHLAVTEWGSAEDGRPTVLLVHGYPDTSAVWVPVAEQLAERFHVATYDVRGAGGSAAPSRTKEYRLDRLVADMAAVADAVSPGRPVHLVGHDWGSIQGWEAVCTDTMAGRIASYTSFYAPGLDHVAVWLRHRMTHPSPHNLGQLFRQELHSWYVVAFHLPGSGLVWKLGLGRRWPALVERLEKVPATPSCPAPTIAADGAQGIKLYRANFGPRLLFPHPRPTTVPVHAVVALHDHYVTPALSEGLERWAPTLWRTEVDAGHWLPRIDPERSAGLVADLVDHVEGGPESPRLARSRVGDPQPVGTGR